MWYTGGCMMFGFCLTLHRCISRSKQEQKSVPTGRSIPSFIRGSTSLTVIVTVRFVSIILFRWILMTFRLGKTAMPCVMFLMTWLQTVPLSLSMILPSFARPGRFTASWQRRGCWVMPERLRRRTGASRRQLLSRSP